MNIEYEKTKNHTEYSRKQLPSNILHWHESIEVCRLISGKATFLIENSTYSFNPGDIVIVSSKNLHCFSCDGENLVDILLIPIHDFIPIIRSYPTMPSYISSEKIDSIPRLKDELDYLFERINEEFDSKQTYARSLSLAFALAIICLLSRHFSPQKVSHERNWQSIQPVLDVIKSDCTNPDYSLSYFAKKLNYTPEYFSYLFKEFAGIGFKEYLDSQRIDEAKRIMISKSVPICDIAEHCGYKNIRTFNNRFKALVHMTPSQFQNQFFSKNSNKNDKII